MKQGIVIIGAGGHGRVVADAARACGYERVVFLDDADECAVPLAGRTNEYRPLLDECDVFVAIGSAAIRERITRELIADGAHLATVIHPSAVIGSDVSVGEGSFIAPGAVVNTGARIGRGVILNTCCSVDHDCIVEDFCHVSVGAHLAGTVHVGRATMIGAGATVINNLSVCAGCTVGAGAVVVRDIDRPTTVVGVPAREIKR